MLKVGLTGGIGSGKTTVAHLLHLLGYPVYNCDREAAHIVNNNPKVRYSLTTLFGDSIYTGQGSLDKTLFASILFADPAALKKANGIIHPAVMHHFHQWCTLQKKTLAFCESAILFEAELEKEFDAIVAVYAKTETRVQRVLQRDGIAREDILKRVNSQLPEEEKREKAHFVICNDDNEMLLPQILEMLDKLHLIISTTQTRQHGKSG